jgi:hypothetical protein
MELHGSQERSSLRRPSKSSARTRKPESSVQTAPTSMRKTRGLTPPHTMALILPTDVMLRLSTK